jgi:hypothetical protein
MKICYHIVVCLENCAQHEISWKIFLLIAFSNFHVYNSLEDKIKILFERRRMRRRKNMRKTLSFFFLEKIQLKNSVHWPVKYHLISSIFMSWESIFMIFIVSLRILSSIDLIIRKDLIYWEQFVVFWNWY